MKQLMQVRLIKNEGYETEKEEISNDIVNVQIYEDPDNPGIYILEMTWLDGYECGVEYNPHLDKIIINLIH